MTALVDLMSTASWLPAHAISLLTVETPSIFRLLSAAITGSLIVLVVGQPGIRWLRRSFRERIVSDSAQLNQLHAAKQGTPTMGGLFVMLATVVSTLLWCDHRSSAIWLGLAMLVLMTAVGAYDDWVKARTNRPGISARSKFTTQLIIGLACGIVAYGLTPVASTFILLHLPWTGIVVPFGIMIVVWFAFVLTATANAVNLTDGLDGLAAGCLIASSSAMTVICNLAASTNNEALALSRFGSQAAEFAVLTSALSGSMLGFLWYNHHPARVFMGDAGSLPAGTIIGLSALLSGQDAVFVIVGGVFVVETLSVVIQVIWYKRTRRRVLLCSPLHNHFVFRGVSEQKIVMCFWTASIVFALAGLLIALV